MKPVRQGDIGPAVEDIQRRLVMLGFDLGRAGVDGIFLGATAEAVREFQRRNGLLEDGWVGDQTWSAIVDATFRLGDRMLYLKVPHFHGHDVALVQHALNVLGFACGDSDGIFGAFTERAVGAFQANAAITPDGIVGPETVKALLALRHVWEGKEPKSHSAAHIAKARAGDVLARVHFTVGGLDDCGDRIAGRVVNLALATSQYARVSLVGRAAAPPGDTRMVMRIACEGTPMSPGVPVLPVIPAETLIAGLRAAIAEKPEGAAEVVISLGASAIDEERQEQRVAVGVLDAVCAAFE